MASGHDASSNSDIKGLDNEDRRIRQRTLPSEQDAAGSADRASSAPPVTETPENIRLRLSIPNLRVLPQTAPAAVNIERPRVRKRKQQHPNSTDDTANSYAGPQSPPARFHIAANPLAPPGRRDFRSPTPRSNVAVKRNSSSKSPGGPGRKVGRARETPPFGVERNSAQGDADPTRRARPAMARASEAGPSGSGASPFIPGLNQADLDLYNQGAPREGSARERQRTSRAGPSTTGTAANNLQDNDEIPARGMGLLSMNNSKPGPDSSTDK